MSSKLDAIDSEVNIQTIAKMRTGTHSASLTNFKSQQSDTFQKVIKNFASEYGKWHVRVDSRNKVGLLSLFLLTCLKQAKCKTPHKTLPKGPKG